MESDCPVGTPTALLDPAACPPMLRHYVSLKAAPHPMGALLYRLGDFFFDSFSRTPCWLSAPALELTLTAMEAGKGIGPRADGRIPHQRRRALLHELVRHG